MISKSGMAGYTGFYAKEKQWGTSVKGKSNTNQRQDIIKYIESQRQILIR